jgi:hypothetical protein
MISYPSAGNRPVCSLRKAAPGLAKLGSLAAGAAQAPT